MDPLGHPATPQPGAPTPPVGSPPPAPPSDTPPPQTPEPAVPSEAPFSPLSPPPTEIPPPPPTTQPEIASVPPPPPPNFSQSAPSESISEAPTSDPVRPPGGKFYQSKKFLVAAVLVVGAIVSTGLILSQTQKPQPTTETQAEAPVPPLTLSIESPTDGTLVTDSEIMIKGKTSPNTTVLFFTDTQDGSVESDANGNFQGSLTLQGGINTLTITAYSASGEEKTVTMDVVYDEEST